jgi:hypothetical protein
MKMETNQEFAFYREKIQANQRELEALNSEDFGIPPHVSSSALNESTVRLELKLFRTMD